MTRIEISLKAPEWTGLIENLNQYEVIGNGQQQGLLEYYALLGEQKISLYQQYAEATKLHGGNLFDPLHPATGILNQIMGNEEAQRQVGLAIKAGWVEDVAQVYEGSSPLSIGYERNQRIQAAFGDSYLYDRDVQRALQGGSGVPDYLLGQINFIQDYGTIPTDIALGAIPVLGWTGLADDAQGLLTLGGKAIGWGQSALPTLLKNGDSFLTLIRPSANTVKYADTAVTVGGRVVGTTDGLYDVSLGNGLTIRGLNQQQADNMILSFQIGSQRVAAANAEVGGDLFLNYLKMEGDELTIKTTIAASAGPKIALGKGSQGLFDFADTTGAIAWKDWYKQGLIGEPINEFQAHRVFEWVKKGG